MIPYFSVIIPTYNRAQMLAKAIESVISQSFSDWELIVVDDGSSDNTRELVDGFTDERIKYIYQENQERSAARNNGINNARGKYICFLDSDDYYLPERLELLYTEISRRGMPLAMIYTGISFENNGQIYRKPEIERAEFSNIYDFIITATIFSQQCCISRDVLINQQYNNLYSIGEDMELWLRIVSEYPIIYFSGQYTIVATEHEGRSVNERKFNPGSAQLILLKYIFSAVHPGCRATGGIKKRKYSDTYFSIARHYLYTKQNRIALVNLFFSLLTMLKHEQSKHKIKLMLDILSFRRISEYQ